MQALPSVYVPYTHCMIIASTGDPVPAYVESADTIFVSCQDAQKSAMLNIPDTKGPIP